MRELVELAFSQVNRCLEWRGQDAGEVGVDTSSGEILVRIDPRYFRPTEVDFLLGDPSKARRILGWRHKVTFPELVAEMVASDLKIVARESHLQENHHE